MARYTNSKIGWVKGQPIRFIVGHNSRNKTRSIESCIKKSKSSTGREPIFSPYLPGQIFVRYDKRAKRWVCRGIGKTPRLHAAAVYNHFYGVPPEGYHIHHISGNASMLEDDNPDNLVAITRNWNIFYLPTLAKVFSVPETEITKLYLKDKEQLPDEELFTKICNELLNVRKNLRFV